MNVTITVAAGCNSLFNAAPKIPDMELTITGPALEVDLY